MPTLLSKALRLLGVGAVPGHPCWTRCGEAMAGVHTPLRDPGLLGWAGSIRRLPKGHPAWVQPHHVPFSAPGLGVRTRAVEERGSVRKLRFRRWVLTFGELPSCS